MAEHDDQDAELPQRDAGGRRRATGPKITGRSFAGTSFAADQREQTRDVRGENERSGRNDASTRRDPEE